MITDPAHTKTLKDGTIWKTEKFETWRAPNGDIKTGAYAVCSNPNSGHGWGGVISWDEWERLS